MKRTVHFAQLVSIPVTVDVDEFAHVDDIIAEAYNAGPGGLCAGCTGGGHAWSRDDAGDLVPVAVTDDDGETIWTDPEQQPNDESEH